MIFYYVRGALMSSIRIKGLTRPIGGFSVYRWWEDGEDESEYYDGHKHFVCESLSRGAAQKIVDALGGYLVPEFAVPLERQLAAGGPFYVHRFHLDNPRHMETFEKAETALDFALYQGWPLPAGSCVRVYGVHGDLVAEFPPEAV